MRPLITLVLAYVGFISLGLPDTVLGAAWPALRAEMGLALDAAGGAVLLTSAGVVISSATSAFVRVWAGTPAVLVGSTLLAAASLAATAHANTFSLVLGAAFVAGLGGGAIDAALNDHIARNHSARHMNWLHASWGIGAALAPALVAAILHAGHTWRRAYVVIALIEVTLAGSFLLTRKAWGTAAVQNASGSTPAGFTWSRAHTGRVLLFLFYAGVEASMGLWTASWLIATRNVSLARAGFVTSLYWGGLTAGRLLVGWLVGHVDASKILRITLAAACVLLVLLAIPQTPLVTAELGLALLGAALGPVFPLLMHETPQRFPGPEGARLVGYQIAGASTGVATIPWLLGAAGRAFTPFAIMPLAALLLMIVSVLERMRKST